MANNFKFFFRSNSPYSNWYITKFVCSGNTYNCVEQYMMYQKAILMQDYEIAHKILFELEPRNQKNLGRKVKNYDNALWENKRFEIVKKGCKLKFDQNQSIKDKLLKHSGKIFVEASPYDRIWGIGFDEKNALQNINNWGNNLLGKVLTELVNEYNFKNK